MYFLILAFGLEDQSNTKFDVTASSIYDDVHGVHLAGLYSSQGWSSMFRHVGEWIQADLLHDTCVNGVVTQGRRNDDQFITRFKVAVGTNDYKWRFVFDSKKLLHVSSTVLFW